LAALSSLLLVRHAEAVKLRVRGGTHIDARASGRSGRLEVRGTLRDDASRPLEGRLRLLLAAGAGMPPVSVGEPTACAPTLAAQLHASRSEVLIDTAGDGSFCLALPGALEHGVVSLSFDGDRLFDKSETAVPIDASRHALLLSFSPEPKQLALERDAHSIWVDTRLEPSDDVPDEPLQLRLVLSPADGKERELARTSVRPGERAELSVRSSDLGDPGVANLSVEFAGSDSVQPARRSARVVLTAQVVLSLPGSVPPSVPSDGVDLDLAVGSTRGAVPGGAVEALVGGQSAGTAPVNAGTARLVAAFAAPTTGVVPVTLRYLPDAPWWVAGDAITVNVPVAPESPWRRLPWVLAALAIGAWVIQSWWRPGRTEKPEPERSSLPPARPSLDVIELGPVDAGWHGRVLDAHEGTPIVGAKVTVVAPSFEGDGVQSSAVSDDQGRFELPAGERAEGARLIATARWHATLEKPLPPPGRVQVNLVSRRRALLGRLVEWANRMGKPWSRPGDATPGHVAGVAQPRRAEDVGAWARAVERAAYGPEAPDADEEGRIREQEPGWRSAESER